MVPKHLQTWHHVYSLLVVECEHGADSVQVPVVPGCGGEAVPVGVPEEPAAHAHPLVILLAQRHHTDDLVPDITYHGPYS